MKQTLSNPLTCDNPATPDVEPILWMVLHSGAGQQRYRWDDWARRTTEWLTSTGYWIAYQVGHDLEIKHRSRVVH